MEERIYSFKIAHNPDKVIEYERKESELDEHEIELMLGTLINEYLYYPEFIRNLFKEHINDRNL